MKDVILEFEIVCHKCLKHLCYAEIPVVAICDSCKNPKSDTIPMKNMLEILHESRTIDSNNSLVISESGKVLSRNGKKEKTWLKIV